MTAKQAANHILAGILRLAEDKRDDVMSMRSVGLHGDADIVEIEMRTLINVASGLSSAIEEGEYDE